MRHLNKKLLFLVGLITTISLMVIVSIPYALPKTIASGAKLQDQQNQEKQLPSLYTTDRTKKELKEIKDKHVKAVLEIIDAQAAGDVKKTLYLMNKYRLTLGQFEMLFSDIIYSVMEANIKKAIQHFMHTEEMEFTIPEYNLNIKRKHVKDLQSKLDQLVNKLYEKRGGRSQFEKNQKVSLKYEKQFWKRISAFLKERQIRSRIDFKIKKPHKK